MRIKIINPNTSLGMTRTIGEAGRSVARPGTELLAVEARKAKDEDGAEAILLGCAGFADFADRIERELDIPVLDGVVCAVKLAEGIVELGKRTSARLTYSRPEPKAYSGILAGFGAQAAPVASAAD